MDIFDMEFPELPSIAPDLMFEDETSPKRNASISTLTSNDRETLLNFVLDDHSYAKPYPILSTSNNKCVTPQTILTLHPNDLPVKKNLKRNESKYQSHGSEDDDEIDIVSIDEPDDFVVKYDKTKAHNGMNEVESYLNSLWKDVTKDDDEKITRGSWSKEQARLFDVVYKLITNYQLAKLAYAKNDNEPVLRKLALDKSTHRIRKAFGTVLWNPKYIVWLHGVMLDGLGSSLFLCYLEILQSLKRKAPILFERVLLFDRAASEKEMTAGLPNLGVRLKKSWDPSTGLQSKVTVEKFPTTPFLIMVPSGPNIPHQSTKRNRFWNNQLMNFSKVFPINVPAYRTLEGYVIKHYLEHCISAIRSKITEFRNRFPERHVVLVGWGVGSLISLKVANLYKVDAIICLGFPCNGIDGDTSEKIELNTPFRGSKKASHKAEYWKGLTKIECPVLFVLGTHATSNSIIATEKLREQMKTQTNLMLIESADEMLRLTKSQKKALGMTQNMIDKLIQDQIYLFLKGVLFKPKPAVTSLPKGPVSGKKRKKKVEPSEKGGETTTKKRRKAQIKVSSLQPKNTGVAAGLLPLDVSISSVSPIPLSASQGLLTTGSVSTSIPVTHLHSETLTTLTTTVLHQTVPTNDVVVSTSRETMKQRNVVKEPKEKIKRSKTSKKGPTKSVSLPSASQKISSTITSHQFSASSNKMNAQPPVAFQRVPTGSFVLSGASGQIRLQGGANILYLQQASSGSAQLLGTPVINASSGAFTAVISSNLVSNPPKINIVPSSNFKFGSANTTVSPQNKGLSAIISSGGCGNLVINSTAVPGNLTPPSFVDTSPNKPVDSHNSTISMACIVSPAIPSTPVPVTSVPAVTTASSTIMTHLSANDLRYLASLIAKHSNSRPNSPMPSPISGPLVLKTDDKSFLKTCRENSDTLKMSTSVSESGMNKSSLISILDKKVALNSPIPTSKKAVQPPSLAQRVASIQQKETSTKMKTPRLKTSKLVSTAINMPMGHIITANSTKSSAIPQTSKVLHKVPVTLTIPISRLPSTLNLSTASALSKSFINVPTLSSYLNQEKAVVVSTKPSGSSPSSRSIVTNPSTAKKSPVMIGNIPICSSQVRMSNTTAFPSSRASSTIRTNSAGIFITKTPLSSSISTFKSPVKSRNPSPITLHLPSQTSSLKDPKVLRKAVSDVKVVGVLSQQPSKSQISPLVNFSTLRSISNPSSPLRSPTDNLHGDVTPDDLSPIHPRGETYDIADLKSDDQKKNFSPMKSTIMAAIADNVKPLSPTTILSSTISSTGKELNVIGRSNITGKVSTTPFLGKLFVGPKSIVDPKRGKVTLSADPYATLTGSSFVRNKDIGTYNEDDYLDDDNTDNDDESDVDFSVSPGTDSPSSNTPVKAVPIDPSKHSNITKILNASNTPSDANSTTTTTLLPKNILDIARAKLRDSQYRSTCVPSTDKSGQNEDATCFGSDLSKLRFEPLKVTSGRAKLTSVLSMRDDRDLVEANQIDSSSSMFKNKQIIVSTVSKQLAASPSTGTSPITNFTLVCEPDSKRVALTKIGCLSSANSDDTSDIKGKSNGLSLHESKETLGSSVDSSATCISVDGGKRTAFTSVSFKGSSLSNPKSRGIAFTNIESRGSFSGNLESKSVTLSHTDSKGTPIRITGNRSSAFSGIEKKRTKSSFSDIDTDEAKSPSHETPEMTKLLPKSAKINKQVQEYDMIVEEEPQPYITRSGRVMKSKYAIQYIDELDRKKTPKRRRLSSSTNQDNSPANKKCKSVLPDHSPTSTVTLENLVEAAKMITKESDSLVNGKKSAVVENVVHHASIDSTTNIAATAMLELLSSDANLKITACETSGQVLSIGRDGLDSKDELQPNYVSHSETISLDPRFKNIVLDKTNNLPVLRNPTDPSLPSLAPILVSKDADDGDDVLTDYPAKRGSTSPIPPLAAIQEKSAEIEVNLPIELMTAKKRVESKDELSRADKNTELKAKSFTKDVEKSVTIPFITDNLEQKDVEQDRLSDGKLPSLAIIQDKSVVENLIVSSPNVTADKTKVITPVTVNPSDIVSTSSRVEIDNVTENIDNLESTKPIVEQTPEMKVDSRPSRSPSSSPPALAVIQNNKPLSTTNINDSNLVIPDNCSVSITDIALVNSLPPLAAIQVNPSEGTSNIEKSKDESPLEYPTMSKNVSDESNCTSDALPGESLEGKEN